MNAATVIVSVMFLVAAWRAWRLNSEVRRLTGEKLQLVRDLRNAEEGRDLTRENLQLARGLREGGDSVLDLDTRRAGAKEDSKEEDDGWPDEWDLWCWYAAARKCAHGCGTTARMGDIEEGMHSAYRAAQIIGQTQGARLREYPNERIEILSAAKLNEQIEELLGVSKGVTDLPSASVTPDTVAARVALGDAQNAERQEDPS